MTWRGEGWCDQSDPELDWFHCSLEMGHEGWHIGYNVHGKPSSLPRRTWENKSIESVLARCAQMNELVSIIQQNKGE